MARNLNQCNFIGRLGKDPESRNSDSGTAITNFSIACSDDYKNKTTGEKVERTNWVPVVAFGRLGEICAEYLSKGSQVFISGKFTVRKWQDQEGNDRWSTEIVANDMQMLDSRGGQGNQGGQSRPQQQKPPQGQGNQAQAGAYDDFNDDIPF